MMMVAKEKQQNYTILYGRYYLQISKAITFGKFSNHTKYEKSNVSSHLHF